MTCYFLCNQKFWNKFCRPTNRGIHIILVCVILNVFYASVGVLMSTYYDNFSAIQHFGYLLLLLGNILFIVSSLLTMHFLSLKPARVRLSYYIVLHVLIITTFLLGVAALVLLNWVPSLDRIQSHVQKYVRMYHRAPYFMKALNIEKGCCGIKKLGDIFSIFKRNVTEINEYDVKEEHIIKFYRIPPSCCSSRNQTVCENWVAKLIEEKEYMEHNSTMLKVTPCFKEGDTYSKVRQTRTYKTYQLTTLVPIPLLILALVIFGILNYYAFYKFPKRPKSERPSGFLEDLGYLVKCQFLKLKTSMRTHRRAQKQVEDDDAMYEKEQEKKRNDFATRHELISQSLAQMRVMHTRDERVRDKEHLAKVENAISSQHVVVPGFSSAKALQKDEKGQWHH